MRLQASTREMLTRAGLHKATEAAAAAAAAAATTVQARWRGALVRARLATEVKVRAEVRAAAEQSSAVKVQAFARGVLKRAELHRAAAAAAAAAVVQGAWRRRQATVKAEERSRAVAGAAVVVQRRWRAVAASAQGRRARYGNTNATIPACHFCFCLCECAVGNVWRKPPYMLRTRYAHRCESILAWLLPALRVCCSEITHCLVHVTRFRFSFPRLDCLSYPRKEMADREEEQKDKEGEMVVLRTTMAAVTVQR